MSDVLHAEPATPDKVHFRTPSYWDVLWRVDRLKELAARNWSAGAIAHDLAGGITRNAVIGKLHRLGISTGNDLNGHTPGTRLPRVSPEPRVRNPVDRRIKARPKPAPVEKPELTELPPDQSAFAMTFRQMLSGDSRCRYPLNDPVDFETFQYCGAKAGHECGAYCARHRRVMRATARP